MKTMLKILVAAHDAGGAQILACLVKKYETRFQWSIFVSGPAVGIFQREGLPVTVYEPSKGGAIEGILQAAKPDFVLTGTGWGSTMEFDFIQEAKKAAIKNAAFLDHWCNYRERFGYPQAWEVNLPDFVFVGDKWSYKMAYQLRFGPKRLCKVENAYWQGIKNQLVRLKQRKKRSAGKIKVLYLSSPIAPHAKDKYGDERHWGFTEYEQLEDILNIVNKDPGMELTVRLHPAEPKDKYAYVKAGEVTIADPQKTDLLKSCLESDIIIGCDSMALVTAWLAGRLAISYISSKKLKSTLPQEGVIKVFSKASLKNRIKMFDPTKKVKYPSMDFYTTAFPKVLSGLGG